MYKSIICYIVLNISLQALGLKSGGTLADRAERLWAVKDVSPDDIPNKYKAKTASSANVNITEADKGLDDKFSDAKQKIAWKEYQIVSICEIMSDVVIATRRHVEKQHTRTAEERRAERDEEEVSITPMLNSCYHYSIVLCYFLIILSSM